MTGLSAGIAAAARADRFAAMRADAYGMRSGGRGGRKPARLHAAPRTLIADGAAAARSWDLADAGAIAGRAYLIPDGWHWVGIVDDLTPGMASGAALLTIGPDGRRIADRYGVSADAWIDLARYFEDDCAATYDAPTPAHFYQFAASGFMPWLDLIADPDPVADDMAADPDPVAELEYLTALQTARLEPLRWIRPDPAPRGPLPWIAADRPELPEFAAIRAQFAARFAGAPSVRPSPVMPDEIPADLEPYGARLAVPRWRRVAVRVARAIYGGWWDGVPDFRRPVLVTRARPC